MTLTVGSHLGPYEILGRIGAGGMGEVYRARDPRLGREVAIKILPASFAQDPERLRRFEHEARTAGALNHPNILAIYDIGTENGQPYLVSELLEGEPLRQRMEEGPLPIRKVLDYATQIANGMAAAHEKGVVHRDLKPENLFVTRDGRVKILDFGLAKFTRPDATGSLLTVGAAEAAATSPGMVLGTVGYMSPEQVRGQPADHRSDIFSFGSILYEMLSGRRAFQAESGAETMSAIVKEDPPDLEQVRAGVPPALDVIVRHCLEKQPEQRFQSARDLAFNLAAMSTASTGASAAVQAAPALRTKQWLWPAAALLALLVGAAAGWLARPEPARKEISYQQLTFRRGTITTARFAGEDRVVYSAAWDGKPSDAFITAPGTPESRPLNLAGSTLAAISRQGDLAILTDPATTQGAFERLGTLARASLGGGSAPRALQENVKWADWGPDGETLALVRATPAGDKLEFPPGKVVFETDAPAWISHARVSPDGKRVLFLLHPRYGDDRGSVMVVEPGSEARQLQGQYPGLWGAAWAPDGRILFTAVDPGGVSVRRLYATTLDGKLEPLVNAPGELTIQDVAPNGDVLLLIEDRRRNMVGLAPGSSQERELTWLDRSIPQAISSDGRTVLFHEGGKAGGDYGTLYLRNLDGSPAVRLAEGYGVSLSPDGKWAASRLETVPPQFRIVPTGPGEPKTLSYPGLGDVGFNFDWAPNGGYVFSAREGQSPRRIYITDGPAGKPKPITPEGFGNFVISHGSGKIAARREDGTVWLFSLGGGEGQQVLQLDPSENLIEFSPDGKALYLGVFQGGKGRIDRLDLASGRRALMKELDPSDPAGVVGINRALITPDGRAYVYGYIRQLSDLYLVKGLL